jgi:hypothetical protein
MVFTGWEQCQNSLKNLRASPFTEDLSDIHLNGQTFYCLSWGTVLGMFYCLQGGGGGIFSPVVNYCRFMICPNRNCIIRRENHTIRNLPCKFGNILKILRYEKNAYSFCHLWIKKITIHSKKCPKESLEPALNTAYTNTTFVDIAEFFINYLPSISVSKTKICKKRGNCLYIFCVEQLQTFLTLTFPLVH